MKHQKQLLFLVLTIVSFGCFVTVTAETNIASLQLDLTPVPSSSELIQEADLIARGRPRPSEQQIPTNQKVGAFTIVHELQRIDVRKVLKGSTVSSVTVIIPGLQPLPETSNPLNNKYPGALAQENYFFFLKKIPDTSFYTIIGGWQGVYPLFEGKTIALRGLGFQNLGGLTVEQFKRKIKG
ncbi:hypothetical protein BEP19_04665 [Ammoniphilus oxalaticus]|uniref:Uncharacterized protein n=1 Tax=Ammoniphilus oxalaticus TaxID=66863 RepID=A0A419SM79_9BACL|nr:hypothetical protein [Ammoniphilus oxalaticus]RKD25116.1 hypothetical protein BEP19_04665 [Ammoniphilus oxalaticus]